jgi:thioredoxin 1
MTNSLPIATPICCPPNDGGDLLPLLLVVVVLLAGHVIFQEFQKWKGKPEMKNFKNLAIVAAVIVAAGLVFALKHNQAQSSESAPAVAAEAVRTSTEATDGAAETPAALPRMVDLGADKCIPCKMMAPILEEMKTAYAGQLEVEFIDVWKNPDAGGQYGIRMIPTQIFFDASGKELFRHEGFYGKEDMLAKWKELGVDLQPKAAQ